MRLPDMNPTGIAIGTSIVPTLIMATSLFLLAVPGGAFTHGITIPITGTAITRMTTHMIIRTTIVGTRTTELIILPLNRTVITMAMRLQASTVTQLLVQYSLSSPALGIITARSTEFSVMKVKPPSPDTNRIRT